MQIFIKLWSGRISTYEVQPTDTIRSLKQQIRDREKTPMARTKLRWRGNSFNNLKTFLDYGVTQETTIQLYYAMGGGSYCQGCILPALICLSAHVSLQCGEDLSFDDYQLLHSIKNGLAILNHAATEAIIGCINTCTREWDTDEYDDAEYFQDHAIRRHDQAIDKFLGAICGIINHYIEKYRTPKMIKRTQQAINYENAYKNPDITDPEANSRIKIDWLTFLHETRCPICFCRFNHVQPKSDAPNR